MKMYEKHGGVLLKFAAPLYAATELFQDSFGLEHAKNGPFMVDLAGVVKQHFGPDCFVAAMERRIDAINPKTNIFITDLRMRNEAEMLKSRGFKLVRVCAPDEIRASRRVDDRRDPTHPTECELDNYEFDEYIESV